MRRAFGRALAAVVLGAAVLPSWATATQARKPAARDAAVTSLTMFAGTPAGLWRSRDWALSWERVKPGLDALGAARAVLALGPWVYVGGDGGLFFSEDFGETWIPVYEKSEVHAVLGSRYPQSDPTLFIGTPTGLLKSTDGGRSFAPTALAGVAVSRLEWPGPALVAATERGVEVSQDAAETFRPRGEGFPPGAVSALALSSYFAVDPVLFASAGEGVHRSTDGGATWTASGLAGRTVSDLSWQGPLLYALTDAGAFRSEDAGKTWELISDAASRGPEAWHGRPVRLLFPLSPASAAEVLLGTDAGLYWSSDGGRTWRFTGLQGESVLSVATFPALETTRKGPKK